MATIRCHPKGAPMPSNVGISAIRGGKSMYSDTTTRTGACLIAIVAAALASCDRANPRVDDIAASVSAITGDLLANCSAATPTGCLTKRVQGKTEHGYTY